MANGVEMSCCGRTMAEGYRCEGCPYNWGENGTRLVPRIANVAATLERAGETPDDAKRMAREAVVDRGPWSVVIEDDGKPSLCSDDFEHDVTLRISGDFADDQQRLNYANQLAAKLNAHTE